MRPIFQTSSHFYKRVGLSVCPTPYLTGVENWKLRTLVLGRSESIREGRVIHDCMRSRASCQFRERKREKKKEKEKKKERERKREKEREREGKRERKREIKNERKKGREKE